MEIDPKILEICEYCEKMNSEERKKAEVEDPELALKNMELMNKLLFAIGLAIFNDYEREKSEKGK
ncbi:hypothetical protein ES708_17212 [subsurface metagenome]